MQLFTDDNYQSGNALDCANEVVETVLAGMRRFRSEMRGGRPADLSVPQFRTLAFLNRRPGARLSDVAEHVGLTMPSMSRAIEALVKRGLVIREQGTGDRRCVTISLTDDGKGVLRASQQAAREGFAAVLSELSDEDRTLVLKAMDLLRHALQAGPATESEGK